MRGFFTGGVSGIMSHSSVVPLLHKSAASWLQSSSLSLYGTRGRFKAGISVIGFGESSESDGLGVRRVSNARTRLQCCKPSEIRRGLTFLRYI